MGKEPRTYKNNASFQPDAPFLSDDAMEEMFDGRPILCVDILLINHQRKTIILPWRIRKPAEGPWFIGGMLKRNLTPRAAAAAICARETKTKIDKEQLEYVGANRFEWDYRDGSGAEKGRVDFNICYAYQPSDKEVNTIASSLHKDEYDLARGLTEFNRSDIVKLIVKQDPAKQVLLDYYDQVFPQ